MFKFPAKFKVPEDWDAIFNGRESRQLTGQDPIEIIIEPIGSQTY